MIKQITRLFFSITILALTVSCSKENKEPAATINEKEVTLYFDEEFQFEIKKGEQIVGFNTTTSSSSDELVGTINNSGLFKAKSVGETTIKIVGDNFTFSTKITVKPYQDFLTAPFLNFSGTKTSVKNYEKRKLEAETSEALLYTGENYNIENVMYGFKNGLLNGSIVIFNPQRSVMEKVATYYLERFEFLGTEDSDLFFQDKRTNVAIIVGINSIGFGATYVDGRTIFAKNLTVPKEFLENNKKFITDKISSFAK